MSIVIHHQQPKWVVVEKPAGLAVHNSEQGAHLLELMREQTGVAWHLVHRLDKATSGLLVLAADAHWTHLLQQATGGRTEAIPCDCARRRIFSGGGLDPTIDQQG